MYLFNAFTNLCSAYAQNIQQKLIAGLTEGWFDKNIWFSQVVKVFGKMFLAQILAIPKGYSRCYTIFEYLQNWRSPNFAAENLQTQMKNLSTNYARKLQIWWSKGRKTKFPIILPS